MAVTKVAPSISAVAVRCRPPHQESALREACWRLQPRQSCGNSRATVAHCRQGPPARRRNPRSRQGLLQGGCEHQQVRQVRNHAFVPAGEAREACHLQPEAARIIFQRMSGAADGCACFRQFGICAFKRRFRLVKDATGKGYSFLQRRERTPDSTVPLFHRKWRRRQRQGSRRCARHSPTSRVLPTIRLLRR